MTRTVATHHWATWHFGDLHCVLCLTVYYSGNLDFCASASLSPDVR